MMKRRRKATTTANVCHFHLTVFEFLCERTRTPICLSRNFEWKFFLTCNRPDTHAHMTDAGTYSGGMWHGLAPNVKQRYRIQWEKFRLKISTSVNFLFERCANICRCTQHSTVRMKFVLFFLFLCVLKLKWYATHHRLCCERVYAFVSQSSCTFNPIARCVCTPVSSNCHWNR